MNCPKAAKVTSDFVLDETITSLSALIGAMDTCQVMEDYVFPSFDIIEVDRNTFRKALSLRKKYHEKNEISFTDFTTVALMTE